MRYHLTLCSMAIIKKSTNNKCWKECGEKGTHLHCRSECKLIQPLWRTIWRFLKKLKNIELLMTQPSHYRAYKATNDPALTQKWKWKSRTCVRLFVTPWTIQSTEFSRPEYWSGLGSHSLLQGIFPTQGSNPGLPHCRQIIYQLSHKGSPRILEGVAYPFSSRSSWPRNWTRVSYIAGVFFTNWAI